MFGEHAGLGGHERGGLGSSGGRATDNYLAQQDRDQDRAQDQDDDQALADQDWGGEPLSELRMRVARLEKVDRSF
jgi:hypothetical protein